MNILKLYDRFSKAKFAMRAFADSNPNCIVSGKDMKVVLYNGAVVMFGSIENGDDYRRYASLEIQCLEVNGDIPEEVISFMKTRIRG